MIINTLVSSLGSDKSNILLHLLNRDNLSFYQDNQKLLFEVKYENKDQTIKESEKTGTITVYVDGKTTDIIKHISEEDSSIEIDFLDLLENGKGYSILLNVSDGGGNTTSVKANIGLNLNDYNNSNITYTFSSETNSFHVTGMEDEGDRIIKTPQYTIRDGYGLYPVTHIVPGAFNDPTNDGHIVDDEGMETGAAGYGNDVVEQIHLPNTIEYIDFSAFFGFSELKRIVIHNEVPPKQKYFGSLEANMSNMGLRYNGVQVPAGSVEAYKEAWGDPIDGFISAIEETGSID